MATCRVCKRTDYEPGPHNHAGDDRFIYYATRHSCHAGCGLDKWGVAFFDRLSQFQINNFPYFTAKRRGLEQELENRTRDYDFKLGK